MSFLLLENGDSFLLESGDALLLEDGPSSPSTAQFFEQALLAKILSITPVTALIGSAAYKTSIPQTHDLGADGPALTYTISTKTYGHVLTGSDGTSVARVKLTAVAYGYGTVKQIVEAAWSAVDIVPTVWGDGSCEIIGVVQQDDSDDSSPPKAGSDQWVYRVNSEYDVKYRVTLPSLA